MLQICKTKEKNLQKLILLIISYCYLSPITSTHELMTYPLFNRKITIIFKDLYQLKTNLK